MVTYSLPPLRTPQRRPTPLSTAMRMPILQVEVAGRRVLKRATLLLLDGVVETVFYPVFPPNTATEHTLAWLRR